MLPKGLSVRRTVIRNLLPVTVLLAAAGCATTPDKDPVQQKLDELDERVARMAASQVELSQRLDEVQTSQRELRGRLDELEHANEALSKQQRDLYSDLDRRVGGGAAAGAAGTAAGGDTGDSGAAGSAAPSSTEQAVYNQAFDALKAGSYSTAITGFKDFLGTYPQSPIADNAQYWLGESYFVTRDYNSAAGAFRTVLSKYPDSQKAPDAMLKLGYTQAEQKQIPAARATLDQVTKKYPGTDSAKAAAERLRKLPAAAAQ
jgi:tol-pal system protein YbgF